MTADWVTAFASCVAAAGVVFVAYQAYLANRQLNIAALQLKQSAEQHKLTLDQFKADHERSRRERAIEVLERWSRTLDRAHPSARTLVEGFSHEQCEKLKQKKGFKIGKDKLELLKNVLHGYADADPPQVDDEHVVLTDNHASHIYFLCISHLNSLEIALQSWLVNVADEVILEKQLKYLIKPDKGHYVLATLRDALGGREVYPAIHEFVDHMKEKISGRSVQERRDRVA